LVIETCKKNGLPETKEFQDGLSKQHKHEKQEGMVQGHLSN